MGYGLLFDVSKCIGCRACEVACKQYNNLPLDSDLDRRHESTNWDTPAPLTGNTLLRMHYYTVEKGSKIAWRFVRRSCFHCERPTCEAVCFAHAFYKTPEGPVLYRRSRCVGCRYCMMGCPFSIPKYEWNELFPEVKKCRMCAPERANIGAPPACVSACPTRAVIFGDRDALLQEARSRIKNNPSRYENYVYGENEVGGTSLLYISDVPFEKLGMKTVKSGQITDRPVPAYTDRALKWTVSIAAVWGAALTTLYLATKSPDDESH
ncbi:MAG: 4Fe-4S dicluster domain-containing protein [Ammonifex sp.]|nr:MAG: 4Fe-4S dicluster domain-containing protein [Ammonifex sp.]